MKSYLCGDEWNSIVAEKDSDSSSLSVSISGVQQQQQEFTSSGSIWGSKTGTRMSDDDFELCSNYSGDEEDDEEEDEDGSDSIKSSEATVTQPMNIVLLVCGGEGTDTNRVRSEKPNSTLKLFQQEDAAIIIQSAFREYLARRQRSKDDGNGNEMGEGVQCGLPSPSPPESLKVQTGDSTDTTSSFHVERHKIVCKPIQKRVKAQICQEEWDDSTVSSSISRKRIQNRIEAATRRERALAYAFAQQLRVCSKKKRTKCNGLDGNTSLSWLERWMATRESENRFMEATTKMMNSIEGKESCGSNEVSLQIHGFSLKPKDKQLTVNNISRRKTVPSAHPVKAGKKSGDAEQEKHKKENIKQAESKKNVKFQDSLSIVN